MFRRITRTGALALAVALTLGVAFSAASSNAGDAVVVFDGRLNLREAPGLDSGVIVVLEDAAPLTIIAGPELADDFNWYQVSTADSTEGWVAGDFITAASISDEFAVGDAIVVANGPLNLREAAGTDAAILDTLDTGITATITGGPTDASEFTWYQIELAGQETGWVASDFIGLASDSVVFEAGDDVIVALGPLNLRGGASTGAEVLETLDEGTTATVVSGPSAAGDYQWYEITVTDGETGWSAGEFLALADSDPGTPVEVDFPIGSFVFVNSEQLNLRADASIDAEILDTLSDGDIATVLDGPVAADGYSWFQVSAGEGEDTQEGWVAGELLAGGVVLGIDAVVADGPLNLREEASLEAVAITQLQIGDTVNVVSGPTSGSGVIWFEVTAGDDTGYVAGRYLGPVE